MIHRAKKQQVQCGENRSQLTQNNRPDKEEIVDSDTEERSDLPDDEVTDDNNTEERGDDIGIISDPGMEEIENEKSDEKTDQDNGISEDAGTSKKPSKPGERPKGRPPNSVKNAKL